MLCCRGATNTKVVIINLHGDTVAEAEVPLSTSHWVRYLCTLSQKCLFVFVFTTRTRRSANLRQREMLQVYVCLEEDCNQHERIPMHMKLHEARPSGPGSAFCYNLDSFIMQVIHGISETMYFCIHNLYVILFCIKFWLLF